MVDILKKKKNDKSRSNPFFSWPSIFIEEKGHVELSNKRVWKGQVKLTVKSNPKTAKMKRKEKH